MYIHYYYHYSFNNFTFLWFWATPFFKYQLPRSVIFHVFCIILYLAILATSSIRVNRPTRPPIVPRGSHPSFSLSAPPPPPHATLTTILINHNYATGHGSPADHEIDADSRYTLGLVARLIVHQKTGDRWWPNKQGRNVVSLPVSFCPPQLAASRLISDLPVWKEGGHSLEQTTWTFLEVWTEIKGAWRNRLEKSSRVC